jgi:diguanylate cyclase (GGDEF)-like protein/PAS domain S-box-containing protein
MIEESTVSNKSKILIVDDKKENLLAMEQIIIEDDLGVAVEIFTVDNGQQALILTLHHDFSLILLDVQMPVMDGYELAELLRVKKKTKLIPIIFLSAVFSSEYYIMKGFESGAVDFLTKPINTKVLLNKIKSFVQLDQQRKTIETKSKSLELINIQLCEQQYTLQENIESLRVLAKVFESCEGIMITDADSYVLRVNHAFQKITGYNSNDIIGKKAEILSTNHQNSMFNARMWTQLLKEGSWVGDVWDKHKDGHSYLTQMFITAVKNIDGLTTEYVCTFTDITERNRAEEEIHHLAFYDSLTDLPNRHLLMDRLDLILSASTCNQKHTAVLFLDMDNFKILNDRLGHDFGDLLLIEVAERIQYCTRQEDTVARFGGDEFIILLCNLSDVFNDAYQHVALIAEKIRLCLSAPYLLNDHQHFSSSSIGVSLHRGNTLTAFEILKQADLAMYQAKEAGRNCVSFFDPIMQVEVETSAALDVDLRQAITDNQFHLYYQIQLNDNQKSIGAEALIRWIHPVRGLVSPADFIPYAESNSLIINIGDWVIETACQQLQLWSKSEQTKNITLAINVSAKQFKQDDFVRKITSVLQRYRFEPSLLKFEITESIVLDDIDKMVAKMHYLKALGVCFSMDDFGTGYSSLSYLKQLPIDQIKIDQSFVRNMTSNKQDEMLVKTIIEITKNFKINVIAEGVETKVQLSLLKQLGCMEYQGYYFSKPVPIKQFELLITTAYEPVTKSV